jgi:type IV pilus assembly protein PilE
MNLVQPGGRAAGFTLIEAMIALAVVAIGATIALPSYIDYLQRSKLVEAKVALSDMRTRLEQHFLDARAYPASCVVPAPGPAPAGQIYLPAGAKYFVIDCVLTPSTFIVTATGSATQGMAGFVFTIDEAERRTTVALPEGWKGAGSPCWVSKRSGEC